MSIDNSKKYILLISDGMADRPLPDLDNKTPMRIAKKPNMDYLAAHGRVGAVYTIPQGMDPGSDVAAMSLLGYDPRKYYTGRGPIEAVSMEIPLDRNDVAYRCNLVTSDGNFMLDYSAGHVTTEEAFELMTYINKRIGTNSIKFYPGISYRHILVWRNGKWDSKTVPPHNISGQPIKPSLPQGDGDSILNQLIYDSLEVLDNHPINQRRRDKGKNPANMIWPWGQEKSLSMPSFQMKRGLKGAVISAVDLVNGLGRAAGLKVIKVPGATGFLDTNFVGKAQYALEALKENDFIVIHVEAPDEAGHLGDIDKKIEAIECIDNKVLGTLLDGLRSVEKFRIIVTPDHATPISLKTHTDEPIPFLIYSSFESNSEILPFDERAVSETSFVVNEGCCLIENLIK